MRERERERERDSYLARLDVEELLALLELLLVLLLLHKLIDRIAVILGFGLVLLGGILVSQLPGPIDE